MRTIRKFQIVALVVLALALAGCASNKTTTTIYGPDGVTPERTIVVDQSDAAMHNQARQSTRLAALQAQRPIGRIIIPDGARLTAIGGDIVFEVNVPTAEHMVNWPQYREPWLEAMQTAGGVVTTGILGYVLGYGDNFQRPAAGPVNYNTTSSGNSSINAWSPSGTANPSTVTPAPVVVVPVEGGP